MRRHVWFVSFVVMVTTMVLGAGAGAESTGRVTGLPVPRFVSIGVEVANLRLGPRSSYDVVAVYRRRGLPLRIVDEFDTWRQVEDHEGTRGWMHQRLLSGRRTVMVRDAPLTLRRGPTDDAEPILVAEPLVMAELLRSEGAWCFVEVDGRRGWLPADGLWGARP